MHSNSPLLLISNPRCGDETGPALVEEHVIPLFEKIRIVTTQFVGHAGEEVLKFLDEHKEQPSVAIILASGDGTLHEIINSVYNARFERSVHIQVSIIPTGTANALYSSLFPPSTGSAGYTPIDKLASVNSLASRQHKLVPLTIAKTTVRSPSHAVVSESFAAVVTSTALHASILHDSESLRTQIPDISRFKVAARNNITRWYRGTTRLRPPEGGRVTAYDHLTGQFVPFAGDDAKSSEPILRGPFAYFLSTVNVDRLEPSFVITPLQSKIRPESNTMDIAIIRPHRDPKIPEDSNSAEDHSRFAEKLGLALSMAYRDGAHINLGYSKDGTVMEGISHEGLTNMVEYVRCGAFVWSNVRQLVRRLIRLVLTDIPG